MTDMTDDTQIQFDINMARPVQIKYNIVPPYDAEAKEHLWTLGALFKVDPHLLNVEQTLNQETLLMVGGPGCYHCERGFTPELAVRPCPGPDWPL